MLSGFYAKELAYSKNLEAVSEVNGANHHQAHAVSAKRQEAVEIHLFHSVCPNLAPMRHRDKVVKDDFCQPRLRRSLVIGLIQA